MPTPKENPIDQLRRMSLELGWKRLHRCSSTNPVNGKRVIWYEAGRENETWLQINETPIGQNKRYSVAVFSFRYRLFSGWNVFFRRGDAMAMKRIAKRLEPWLGRRWFESPKGRSEFRRLHPECIFNSSNWSKKFRTIGKLRA